LAEVIEEHHHMADGGSSPVTGILIAIILIALFLFLFFIFGKGYFMGNNTSTPALNVPEQIDVNVNEGAGQ